MRQRRSLSTDIRVNQLRQSLKKRGKYIEHKFKKARQHDLAPGDAQAILDEATELSSILHSSQPEIEVVQIICDICASAITLYGEPANRPFFFEHMRRLIPPLQNL